MLQFRFDVTMLACHTLSTCNLLLFFVSSQAAAEQYYCLCFEVSLLAFKCLFELTTDALTRDLVVHHVGMLAAAAYAFRQHQFVYAAVFVNVIHLPLALHYSRRVAKLPHGSFLDECFSVAWLLVVGARSAMLSAECAATARHEWSIRWPLVPCLACMGALDVQWTLETFAKRPPPRGWLLLLVAGGGLGASCIEYAAAACVVWAVACALALLLVASAMVLGPWRHTDPAP